MFLCVARGVGQNLVTRRGSRGYVGQTPRRVGGSVWAVLSVFQDAGLTPGEVGGFYQNCGPG